MVDIFIGNNYSRIVGDLSPFAIERLSERLSFVKMGCEHITMVQNGEWDGVVRLFKPGEPFLTGLLYDVRKVLSDNSVEYRLFDRRQITINNFPELELKLPKGISVRDYQEFSANRGIDKTRGVFCLGTGGGKTLLAILVIAKIKVKPFMFYVLTRDLLYQAKEALSACLNCEIGQIGDSVCDIKDINVCTKDAVIYALNKGNKAFDIRNYRFDECDIFNESEIFGDSDVAKIVDVVKNCRGFYIDECHHASSATLRDLAMASPQAYWRFGGTATMEREDGEEILIQGILGRKIVDISLSYLIRNKWLVPAGLFFVPIITNHMPFQSYGKVYSHCVTGNEEVAKKVAGLTEFLVSLGKSNLILVSKISHGKLIKSFLPKAIFLTGKDSSKKRNKAIDEMRSGKKKILIATTLADEGLDIKRLDVVHMVGAGASITRVPQRIGRIVRLSPETQKRYGIAIYYHFCTEYLYEHGQKAKKMMSEESMIEIIQTNDYDDLKTKIIRYMQKHEPLNI